MAIRIEQTVEALASDWRHRDQLAWQLPSILLVLAGGLITVSFGSELAAIRTVLLWAGAAFTFLLSFALLQNLYLQTVAEDLMEAINRGENVEYHPVPKRKKRFLQTMGRTLRPGGKMGSTLLLAACIGVTALLIILAIQPESYWISVSPSTDPVR